MPCWWTCPACQDRMQIQTDPRYVERDRDEHLRRNHQGQSIEPHLLIPSHWRTADEPRVRC